MAVDPIDGWEQVQRSRASTRPGGAALLEALLVGPVWLTAPRGDRSVVAAVGRLDGHGCVAVALAAVRSGRPTPDGFRLLVRAAGLAGRWALPLVTFVDSPGAEPGPDSENDGLALAISDAFAAVLACPSPSVGVLTGEGGSGGALSALVCDTLLATPDSYFAALVPEGAAAALRTTPADAARQLALTPAHLLANQVADGIVPVAGDSGFTAAIGAAIAELLPQDPGARLAAREARWAGPLHPAARRA